MPRGVVPFLPAAILALTCPSLVNAGEYWGAVSVAPDGIFAGAVQQYSADMAKNNVLAACRKSSKRPDECVVSAVSGSYRSVVGWFCQAQGDTDGIAIITTVVGASAEDHMTEMAVVA
jgi:hypothetical protein